MEIKIEPLSEQVFQNLASHYPWPDGFWLRSNFVQSLNGKVTDKTKNLYLASESDKTVFRYLRSTADCLLIGSKTAISEPYQSVKASTRFLPFRANENPVKIAIVSNTLDFPKNFLKDFKNTPILFTNQKAANENLELAEFAQIIVVGELAVEVEKIKPALIGLNLNRVLCEGGATLLTSLVNAQIVDELDLTIANRFMDYQQGHVLTDQLKGGLTEYFQFKSVLFDHENLFLRNLKK
jgi:5-amino-6-(5-phosphoribosylamino)uracil reductase